MALDQLKLTVADSADSAAQLAAGAIAHLLNRAVDLRGHASIALSGGSSPVPLLGALARQSVPWGRVHVFQVDERQVPIASGARNWAMIESTLVQPTGARARPLSIAPNARDRVRHMLAHSDAARLARFAGDPVRLDVVHLGLGTDGHTASWPPGHQMADSTEVVDQVSNFNGHDRVTLTPRVVNAARHIVWFVVGQAKAEMLARLLAGDRSIPAGQVAASNAQLFTDVTPPVAPMDPSLQR